MKHWIALLPAAALIAGCHGHINVFDFNQTKGSGRVKTENRKVGAFTQIETRGSTDCTVTVGGSQSVQISADDNILPLIETRLEGKTLVISCKGSFSTKSPIRAMITVPSLEAFSVSGSGDSTINGIKGSSFSVSISGSGDIEARGQANKVRASISGSGDLDLSGLRAVDADASIAGSGDIRVYATGAVAASIAGSGDITCLGKPQRVSRSVVGSGEVHAG